MMHVIPSLAGVAVVTTLSGYLIGVHFGAAVERRWPRAPRS